MPYTSNETFKYPRKRDKCSWHPCKFFCFMATFPPFLVSLSSCFQEQSAPETNSEVNKHEIQKKQPSMTSPLGRCWGQTATKRGLEKKLWYEQHQWLVSADAFLDWFPSLQHGRSSLWTIATPAAGQLIQGARFYGGNHSPQPLQIVFSC